MTNSKNNNGQKPNDNKLSVSRGIVFLADERIRIILRKILEINLESEKDVNSAKQYKKLYRRKINQENNFLSVEQTKN